MTEVRATRVVLECRECRRSGNSVWRIHSKPAPYLWEVHGDYCTRCARKKIAELGGSPEEAMNGIVLSEDANG